MKGKTLHLTIKEERVRRGWTQEYTAKAANITKAAYRNIEAGIRKPSYDVLIKLMDLFEYDDPRKLFGAATSAINETPGGNQAKRKHLQK